MRVTVLASGSGGNALIVEAAGTCVMVDCGLPLRSLQRRVAAAGLDLGRMEAVLITHEHTDHVRGLELLLRRVTPPVLATAGTAAALGLRGVTAELTSGRELQLGGLRALPVAISHDAREPVGFIFDDGVTRIGIATDTGLTTQVLLERLAGCHGLFLESNHDPDMLRLGPYPWPLKQRIASRTGHLSNDQTRDALELLLHDELSIVVAMHLSRENNHPALVRRELARALAGSAVEVAVADQDEPVVVELHGRQANRAAGATGTV